MNEILQLSGRQIEKAYYLCVGQALVVIGRLWQNELFDSLVAEEHAVDGVALHNGITVRFG